MTPEEQLRHGRWVHENYLGDYRYADSDGRPVQMSNVDMLCAMKWRKHLAATKEREPHGREDDRG